MSTPKPLCRLTEIKSTSEIIGSFLKAPDLGNLCQTSKNSQLLFSKQLREIELIKAVFDADPKKVKEILAKPRPIGSKSLVLVRTHVKETYPSKKVVEKGFFFNKKVWKMICKREWNNISPLEAAAWCGDIFLVRELLSYVPETQREEAAKQLKSVFESRYYLAPYKELIRAYKIYIDQFYELCQQRNYEKIKSLWNNVLECQKKLPTYGLQEYCDEEPFYPLPSFNQEPQRSCLYNFKTLDLDSIPFGETLYKGEWCGLISSWTHTLAFYASQDGGRGAFDLAAMTRLCEVRTIELSNIIKELEERKLSEESELEEDKEAVAHI